MMETGNNLQPTHRLIVEALRQGEAYFITLQDRLRAQDHPVAFGTLYVKLQQLVACGVVVKRIGSDFPRRAVYSLPT